MQGKLIVIDGSDGSGKKTQSNLLIKKLQQFNKEVVFFDFPQYDKFYGKIVAKYLAGEFGKLNEINPYLVSLPYALDRSSVRQEMVEAINQGKIVLCNRYTCSNLAHQSARFETKEEQNEYVKWDEELEYVKNKMPLPDLVIYLHVPYLTATKLVEQKQATDRSYVNGKKKDLHEENSNFMQKSEQRYLELVEEKKWHKISCVQNDQLLSIEEVEKLVWEAVNKFL